MNLQGGMTFWIDANLDPALVHGSVFDSRLSQSHFAK
jgi:hypothetical protein